MYHKLYNTNFKRTDKLKQTVIHRHAHTLAKHIYLMQLRDCIFQAPLVTR